MNGKIKTAEMKVNCLIQAQLGTLQISDFSLTQDVGKIFRAAVRIGRCLQESLWQRNDFKALYNAVLLSKCFKSNLWENSKHLSRQLSGIGTVMSNALVNAGKVTFQKIEETNPRDLELIVNRHPPFGNQIIEAVSRLPKYELCIDQSTNYSATSSEICVRVSISNIDIVKDKSTTEPGHTCVLLIGDADNKVVFKTKISDAMLKRTACWSKKIDVKRALKGEELSVNFISQDWVGLDVSSTYTPFYSGPKRVSRTPVSEPRQALGNSKNSNFANKRPQSTPVLGQSTYIENIPEPRGLLNGRKPCNHKCTDKDRCSHECCKYGVGAKKINPVEKLRRNMQDKIDKMDLGNVSQLKASLGQFAYTPNKDDKLTHKKAAVVPPTPKPVPQTPQGRGWEEVDLHMGRSMATEQWYIQNDPSPFGEYQREDNNFQEPQMEAYTVEDFQDEPPELGDGYLPDLHAPKSYKQQAPATNSWRSQYPFNHQTTPKSTKFHFNRRTPKSRSKLQQDFSNPSEMEDMQVETTPGGTRYFPVCITGGAVTANKTSRNKYDTVNEAEVLYDDVNNGDDFENESNLPSSASQRPYSRKIKRCQITPQGSRKLGTSQFKQKPVKAVKWNTNSGSRDFDDDVTCIIADDSDFKDSDTTFKTKSQWDQFKPQKPEVNNYQKFANSTNNGISKFSRNQNVAYRGPMIDLTNCPETSGYESSIVEKYNPDEDEFNVNKQISVEDWDKGGYDRKRPKVESRLVEKLNPDEIEPNRSMSKTCLPWVKNYRAEKTIPGKLSMNLNPIRMGSLMMETDFDEELQPTQNTKAIFFSFDHSVPQQDLVASKSRECKPKDMGNLYLPEEDLSSSNTKEVAQVKEMHDDIFAGIF